MAVILDFIHNAMSMMHSDHTTVSSLLENPKIEIKIMNLLQFCREWNYLFSLGKSLALTNCSHLVNDFHLHQI